MSEYYIGKNNQRMGPYPLEQLLSYGLTPDSLVWCNGMPGWQKAIEVPEAIRKGMQDARKNMITVPIEGTTVPHATVGRFGAGRVLIMPAAKGTGIIAGGAARPVFELAGIQDIRCKSIGSDNATNVVKATLTGLGELVNAQMVAAKRGKTVEEILK